MKDVVALQSIADAAPLISRQDARAGYWVRQRDKHEFPIPARLNLILVVVQVTIAFGLLALASRLRSQYAVAGVAFGFAFAMQMGYCLAHEAVHRKLHPNPDVNMGLGVFMFSLFPGSIHFFEIAHLIHHSRNRSDDELEDYVLPGETAWIKRGVYYLLISGLFWLLLPLSSILVALYPGRRIRMKRPDEDAGVFVNFGSFLNDVRPNKVRRDVLAAALVWAAAVPLLHLHLWPVVLCYAAFGFSWASQQYIYHVRTPRHAVLGALDLKLWQPVEMLYLHFNYHLTHHLAAWVPWIYLPKVAADPPRQGYFKTYVELWQPPQTIATAWPAEYQESGPLPSRAHGTDLELPW